MVKKAKDAATGARVESGGMSGPHLADTIRESAQQIWHAGLGAFAKAQAEGGKVFETLVKEGKTLESATRKLAEEKLSGFASNFGRKTEAAGAKASATWDKLEQVFEDRVARALGRLGVPSARELETLAKRVEELTDSVRALSSTARSAKASAQRMTGTVAKRVRKGITTPVAKRVAKRGTRRAPQ